jgi:hypothetical protein
LGYWALADTSPEVVVCRIYAGIPTLIALLLTILVKALISRRVAPWGESLLAAIYSTLAATLVGTLLFLGALAARRMPYEPVMLGDDPLSSALAGSVDSLNHLPLVLGVLVVVWTALSWFMDRTVGRATLPVLPPRTVNLNALLAALATALILSGHSFVVLNTTKCAPANSSVWSKS